jgi:hypothetical protein
MSPISEERAEERFSFFILFPVVSPTAVIESTELSIPKVLLIVE